MSNERAAASASLPASDTAAATGETTTATNTSSRRQQEPLDSSELPFLVTHWLRNFQNNNNATTTNANAAETQLALQRIQRATADLASAFSSLGAFGNSTSATLNLSVESQQQSQQPNTNHSTTHRNTTFEDLNRQWAGVLPGNHLNNLVNAAVSTTIATEDVVSHCAPSNLVDAANEAIHQQRRNPSSGRTVQDAINLEDQEGNNEAASIVPVAPSILQPPAKVEFDLDTQGQAKKPKTSGDPRKMPKLESEMKNLRQKSSQTMRKYLDLKVSFQSQDEEIRKLNSSLQLHQKTKDALQQTRLSGGASLTVPVIEPSEEEQNADRVIAQLERKLGELTTTHTKTTEELAHAKQEAFSNFRDTKNSFLGHRDPFCEAERQRSGFGVNVAHNNGILRSLERRQFGLKSHQPSATGLALPSQTGSRIRNALVVSRLSHAATINCHIQAPVYCLRFDRTGSYFVTGADDTLVKVFRLGTKQAIDDDGKRALGPGHHEETVRGAVLVCTLRGHAGVICDIDISMDNCFIATASEDHDCRVWGLKDGAPVAMLRGHVGGCNMVSWSKLTPYQLVTAGDDGFARTWDIREAALKRYGKVVGGRPEYALRLTQEEQVSNSERRNAGQQNAGEASNNDVVLPPIPDRQNQNQADASGGGDPPPPPVNPDQVQVPDLPDQAPVAPLPLPAPAAGADADPDAVVQNPNLNNDAIVEGAFVPNDDIDEGVKLLAKFQHGSSLEERMAAPGTRSRRAAVKILCVVRCPLGGHFATGATDGICRLWEDSDDLDAETVDKRFCKSALDWMSDEGPSAVRTISTRGSTPSNKMILQLKGHLNAITDLQYSNAGDRIMTGSQRDAVIRLWSWDVDPSIPTKDRGLRSIVIKLTNPMASTTNESKKTRRRAAVVNSSKESKIQLDVAVWSHDDSTIITSQSQPTNPNANKIQPDSNFIFLWDSQSGHCLLGIAGAHSMVCQVVLPHPTNASIFASGGMDGLVKVWDCETGKCLFSHHNESHRHQGEAAQQAKDGGFLDGAFFPDGTGFVMTDNSGSVSVFDSVLTAAQRKPPSDSSSAPSLPLPPFWLKEQYFSNDYYDLSYDSNGYCVEKGSQQPPHLAPRGVRCSPLGTPFPDAITDAFKKLVGPLPSPVQDCRWLRESLRLRSRSTRATAMKARLSNSNRNRRGNIMQEYDPLTTILVRSSGEVIQTRNERGEILLPTSLSSVDTPSGQGSPSRRASASSEPRRSAYSGRQLSSNYRWRDYTDMISEEFNYDDDSDDEEFQPTARSNRAAARARTQSEDDESEDEQMDSPSPPRRQASRQPAARRSSSHAAPARRSRNNNAEASEVAQPSRSSRRRLVVERNRYEEPESDEEIVELVSTNNDPTGPHVEDYHTHYFRLTSSGTEIAREWLRRVESDSGYQGRKVYSPQVGDSVVYIPRAHFETIQSYPSIKAPWQDWPPEAEWPVVCCCIRDIRYRFPYIDYYGSRNSRNQCNSVVAILSLEVMGIPVIARDRDFMWQNPSFSPPARSHIFEVGVFQSDHEEFVIPFDRYVWRLQCLQEAIMKNHGMCEGIEISTYYENEEDEREDADLIKYPGKLDDYNQLDNEHNDDNLNNCGFSAIRIGWLENEQHEDLSPWDVVVEKPKSKNFSLSRPCLDDDEKRRARDALNKLKRIPAVREQLEMPVNQRQYSDYSFRVEVPMNIRFVERRLDANYYSSRMSIVADIRLIRDNCIKYNGEVGGLQDDARKMYADFEKELLSPEERKILNDISFSTARETTGTRSSLENLPEPSRHDEGSSSSRRRSLRIRLPVPAEAPAPAPARNPSGGRSLRSNSEVASNAVEPSEAAFANATRNISRARQSRRGSNDNNSFSSQGRRRRGMAQDEEIPQPEVAPAARRSSRGRGAPANGMDQGSVNDEIDAAVATNRRTRTRGVAAQPPPIDGHSSESESDAKQPARATRNSRRASAGPESNPESDSESEVEHATRHQPTRRASRSRRETQNESEEESDPESESEPESPPPTSPRKRKTPVYAEESDAMEEASSEAEGEEEEEEEEEEQSNSESEELPARRSSSRPARSPKVERSMSTSSRPSRRLSQESAGSASRRSTRGRQVASYADNSGSEFEEPPSEPPSEEEEGVQRRSPPKRTASRKRKAATPKKRKSTPKKRPKKRKKDDSSDEDSDDEFFYNAAKRAKEELPSRRKTNKVWTAVERKDITKVTKSILSHLRSLDQNNLFEDPVLESFPEIKQAYNQIVTEPMDFRTIEEERLQHYFSISELQKDLTLIFKNCIAYNGSRSEFGDFAQQMLNTLDDVFDQAVASL